jgi:tetratricopeptide (TPR) repeat protein
MPRLPHPALAWTANVLVPGSGLVLAGRLPTGVACAVLWTAAVGLLLLATLVWPDAASEASTAALAVAAGLLFLAAQGLLYVRMWLLRRHRTDEARDAAFREVLAATLRGDVDEAEQGCRRLLARDPDDLEATLHLALLARRTGRPDEALRLLRRARFLDDSGRWDFQIERDLAALAGPPDPPSASS